MSSSLQKMGSATGHLFGRTFRMSDSSSVGPLHIRLSQLRKGEALIKETGAEDSWGITVLWELHGARGRETAPL